MDIDDLKDSLMERFYDYTEEGYASFMDDVSRDITESQYDAIREDVDEALSTFGSLFNDTLNKNL